MTDAPPVLMVHGIWNTGAVFDKLALALAGSPGRALAAVDLVPNDGSAALEDLAAQLEPIAQQLRATSGSEALDVVGFSMGALVCRYWLQRLGGKHITRRYISISGPHAGTTLARFSRYAGVRQMRPGSDWLHSLGRDPDPFGGVEVHTLGTPFDLMIVPSSSCRQLPGCQSHTSLPVLLHRWMLTDDRAVARIASILDAPASRPG